MSYRPRTRWGRLNRAAGRMFKVKLTFDKWARIQRRTMGIAGGGGMVAGGGFGIEPAGGGDAYLYETWNALPEDQKYQQFGSERAEQIGTALYYGQQMARMLWYYAQEGGIAERLDPSVSGRVELGMAMSSQMMGLSATLFYSYASAQTGNVWGAAMGVMSIPIQLQAITDTWSEWEKSESIRLYHDRRLKRIREAIH